MKYNIIKLQSKESMCNYSPLFIYEEGFHDNCFCIFETEKYNLGFTYYNLGISEKFLVIGNILFLGFGITIFIYDLTRREERYVKQDELQIIYEIIYFKSVSKIIYVCEYSLLCFSDEGLNLLCETYPSMIYDWLFDENTISIKLEDGLLVKICL